MDTPLTARARRLPELAWCKFRRLAARWRPADRHALRRCRAAASRGHAARRARATHVLSRAGDRGALAAIGAWRRASCSSGTWAATRMRRSTGMTRPRVPCACSPTARVCTAALVWSHDGKRVAFHGTGRDGVSYDLFIAEPANNVAAAPGVQRLSEELVGARLVARRHQTTDAEFRLGERVAPLRAGHRHRGAHAGQRRQRAGERVAGACSRPRAAASTSSPTATASSSSCGG